MGTATPALTATATSGLAVSFASTTPTVCTVSGTKLTLITTGSCTVTATQPGNTGYAAAAAIARTFNVAAAPVANSAVNGKALYASNSCSACHGAPPSTQKVLNGANKPNTILSAINGNTGGMGMYSGKLTTQQLADIAAYLATPGI